MVSGASSAVIVPLTAEHAEETFDVAEPHEHRFAALDADGAVLGWVATSRVADRCAYAGVVEYSVHVHPGARGRGIAAA
ncbi:L-amino acid N-acyltransferase YncA [Streptomyces glaucescens]